MLCAERKIRAKVGIFGELRGNCVKKSERRKKIVFLQPNT